ncbi:MAG TPA: NAD-dependent malic enzyme, partial [Lachnospiraceae bacterium]|nr:NAD-dependent malic enzyme [Lachnospiraceae bacterium]
GLNPAKEEIAKITNKNKEAGSLADVVKGKDIFLGVSAPGVLTTEMVSTMAKDSIIFAMANPTPEIMPDEAKAGGAAVVATGRSDFPNQINNVLVFPGIFRGALDARATAITEEMKRAAALAIASIVKDDELTADYIIPDAFNPEVAKVVAKAVADEAKRLGITKYQLL